MTQTVVGIGTRKGLWLARSEDRRTWSLEGPRFMMREVPSIAFDTREGRDRVLVGVRSEHWGPTVMRSEDGGRTWDETPEGAIRFPEDTGAALARVWQLVPDPHDADVVWAGTEPHGLWRSADGGRTFELVRGLWDHPHRPEWGEGAGGGAIHTILPDPRSDESMLVAMSTGGVYRTADAGHTWEASNRGIKASFYPDPFPEFGQCVHKVARDAAEPSRLYAQNHHGVYRSDDDGASWESIAEGLPTDFGFVMQAHPRRGDSVWVVPITSDREHVPPHGELQVQHTTDAGRTWQVHDSGLPQPSWTCVLRDASGVDSREDTGFYFGTRNGDVYASTDGGASFTRIAEQLPDVLCVRAVDLP